ncbi:hypothetical protein [Kitasatospora sp. NPDC056800]|uniref:hypothetical protein n=1 Tax=Kitasatospora sp. NPDC056800 TaxID=3345948 RepID=UPI00367C79BC
MSPRYNGNTNRRTKRAAKHAGNTSAQDAYDEWERHALAMLGRHQGDDDTPTEYRSASQPEAA